MSASCLVASRASGEAQAFRRAELPGVHALADAVRARPKLAAVWARHIR